MSTKRIIQALALAAATGVGAQASAALVGLWEFEDGGNLGAATTGSDLSATGAIASTAGSGGPDTGAASVGVGQFYTATNPIGANGGGANSNEYSIVMDINTTTGGFQSLLDQETTNFTDGDLFLNGDGIGINGDYAGTVPSDQWTRIVVVYDLGSAAPISIYVDGTLANVVEAPSDAGAIDTRHSLLGTFDVLSDNGGGEEAVTGLSNLALFDTALSASQVTALGGAGRVIVPEPGSLALLGLGGLMIARRRRA